jgi:hypothetical protein
VDVSPSGKNWIFRSNFPSTTINGTKAFAFPDPLMGMMAKRAAEEGGGKPFPSTYYFHVITFDNILEIEDELLEIDYFDKHNSTGTLTSWPLVGMLFPPQDVDNATREEMAKNASLWDIDQLPSRLATLRSWFLDESGPSTVFLYHCEAGCDRTGEFSAAYYMDYKQYNVTGAYARDCLECGRCPNYWSSSAIGWWCETREVQGYPEGDCLTFAGNN